MPRPKEFDTAEALDKAMQVFWHKGYEATSIDDLLTAMDLNRGSLYDTFGDKHQLFLACLDRYCTGLMGERLKQLEQPGPGLAAIKQFIATMGEGMFGDPSRRGCLLANTAMELAPHEKDIGLRVSRSIARVEEAFFNALTRAKRQGELRKEQDPRSLARYLTGIMQGVVVMFKAGAPEETLRDIMKTGLSVLG